MPLQLTIEKSMIEAIKILWAVFKLGKMIYQTYFDDDPLSSGNKSNALKDAMDAVNEGDILKLNSAIDYFGRVSKSK